MDHRTLPRHRAPRRMLTAAAALAAALTVSACSAANVEPPAAVNEPTFKIGVLLPVTGTIAALGERAANAVALAIEQSNASDAGFQVEYVVGDDKADPATGVTEVRRLIQQEGVDAILGGVSSGAGIAELEVANDLETPFIVIGAVSPDIPRLIAENSWEYGFMSTPTGVARSIADAEVIDELIAPERIYTVAQETAYGIPVSEGYIEEITRLRPDVVIESDTVPAGNTDYSSIITKIGSYGPDFIDSFLSGSENFSFLEQLRAAGIDTQVFIHSSDAASPTFIETLGAPSDGVLCNLVWVPELTAGDPDVIEAFVSGYEEKYGSTPADVEAQAYDSTLMLLAALAEVDDNDKAAIAETLGVTEINGLRGPQHYLSLEEGHGMAPLPYVIAQIQGTEYVRLWPKDLADGEVK